MSRQSFLETIQKRRLAMQITEPTSSWDVMEWVIQAVKEEPRRLNMATWGGTANPENPHDPPCGTVACFSGWSNVRVHGNLWAPGNEAAGNVLSGYETGLFEEEHDSEGYKLRTRLYYGLFVDDALTSMAPGVDQVAAVEQRAREIMAEFESRLKRTIIYPDGHTEVRGE